MRMYLQLPEAHGRDELVGKRRISTVLSTKMGPGDRWDLLFSQTEDGQVEISSLSRMSRSRILDSFEVGPLRIPSIFISSHALTWSMRPAAGVGMIEACQQEARPSHPFSDYHSCW